MMAMKKYFYRLDSESRTGVAFRKFWHDCTKAAREADAWAKRVGAEQYYSSPSAFEGGVVLVSFGDRKPDGRIWRTVGKDADGIEMYELECSQRSGEVTLKRGQTLPTNTQTRIYSRQARKKEDGTMAVAYIELYREDYEREKAGAKRKRMNKWQREAVSLERSRMQLPVVRIEALYQLLQADTRIHLEEGKAAIRNDMTPTFFEYGQRFYISIDYPCAQPELEEISCDTFVEKRQALMEAQRNETFLS
jgi:hypothetical protein